MSYKDSAQSVPGQVDRGLFLFTLSTCIWCRKTKALLKELGLAYDFVDVDLLEGADKEEMMEDLVKYNPSTSFPTILVDGGKSVLLGFDEEKINGLV
jgi:glutaredoxin-like protein NrdH